MIKNKKILIIGGAGFIGFNLALNLKKLGAEVVIIDSLYVNNLVTILTNDNFVPNPRLAKVILENRISLLKENDINVIYQDARDYHSLSNSFHEIKPEIVVHLAAVSHANKSNKDPYSTFDHSLRTLENALDCSRGNVEHFIFNSSSMVYGNFDSIEVNEDSVCNPIGIYGALKFAAEKLIIAYNQVFELPYTIIRPSALYGRGCISRRVGQVFIENALQEKEIVINGNGEEKLDFTSIDDLLDGFTKVLENRNSKNQIFNLTFGKGRSILEMIEILKTEFPNIKIKNEPRDALMPERGTLSIEKARSLLGYQPKLELETGYVDYIKWYKKIYQDYKNI